ncbi:MAG TPA: hypothetical protein VJ912_03340 [Candidatus Nanoarchaeia archaeon]|nr:hypothetical protein [Candidatus Nanoarchaeia archaeon]
MEKKSKSLKKLVLGITAGITALTLTNCSSNLYKTDSIDPLYYSPEKQKKEYITQKEYNSLDNIDSEKSYVIDTNKIKDKNIINNYTLKESKNNVYPDEGDYQAYDFDGDGIIDWNDPWPHRYGPFKDMNNNHIVDYSDWQISGFTNDFLFEYPFHSSSWYNFYGEEHMSSVWFWQKPVIGWNFGWPYNRYNYYSNFNSHWYHYSNSNWYYWNNLDDYLDDYYKDPLKIKRKTSRKIRGLNEANKRPERKYIKRNEERKRSNYIRVRKRPERKRVSPIKRKEIKRPPRKEKGIDKIQRKKIRKSNYNIPQRQTQRKFNNTNIRKTNKKNNSINKGSIKRKSNSSKSRSSKSSSSSNSSRKRKKR